MELNSAGLCRSMGARDGQIFRISAGRSLSGPPPKAGPMIQVWLFLPNPRKCKMSLVETSVPLATDFK
jgi:hypothetical protein